MYSYSIERETIWHDLKCEKVIRVDEGLSVELNQARDPNYLMSYAMATTDPISTL